MLDGKKCFQEYDEPVVRNCPIGYMNVGSQGAVRCAMKAEKVSSCPSGSVSIGKSCQVTESVPAIPFCAPGFNMVGKGCVQVVDLPIVQRCDVCKLMGKQCLLEDRSQLIVETYCPTGYVETSKGCQRTSTYDCTRPQQSKKGVGSNVGQRFGRQSGHNYGGGYYRSHKLRMLGEKKKHNDNIVNYGKDVLPPPVIEVVSKQCERIEFARPESKSFCAPGYSQNGKACVKLIRSEPREVCSNGGSVNNCTAEKFAPLQHQCATGYSLNGMKCSANKDVPMNYACPMGFSDIGSNCEQTAETIVSCPNGLIMRSESCIGKRFAEPIVTQQVTCVGKGCNEGAH